MAKGETYKRWAKEEVLQITIRPNRTTDADIVQAITRAERNGEPKSAAVMRLIRQGILYEQGR